MGVILIVEDDILIRDLTEVVVRSLGHSTLAAGDVDEALSILRSPQHIDVLFTDVYLKTAIHGGCDLANQAIKLRPNLHVLYTTGNLVTVQLRALFVEGMHCLRKPYTDLQLQDSFAGLLAL